MAYIFNCNTILNVDLFNDTIEYTHKYHQFILCTDMSSGMILRFGTALPSWGALVLLLMAYSSSSIGAVDHTMDDRGMLVQSTTPQCMGDQFDFRQRKKELLFLRVA